MIKSNETHRVKSLCDDSECVGTLAGICVENVLRRGMFECGVG